MKNNNKFRYQLIGKRIKLERKKAGLTQNELAERTGISKSYLTKIEAENCYKSFSLEIIFDICDVLDLRISKIFDDIK